MKRKIVEPKTALERLRDLCARSEQCSGDILRKLYNWGVSASNSAKIVEILERDRYIDDERFARAFVRDKYRFSGWGRLKIMIHLSAKRIEKSIATEALEEIDEEEYRSIALKALKAKARTIPDSNTYEGRTKLFRFGAARGYEAAMLSGLIKSGEIWD